MERTPVSPPCSAGSSPSPCLSTAVDREETDSQQLKGVPVTPTFFPTPTSSMLDQPITSEAEPSVHLPAAMATGHDLDMDTYPDSITSSVNNHVFEEGLRYHAFRDGKYAFPNNEAEQERLDMKHDLWARLLHGALFTAPIHESLEAGGRVFDLGTGTGQWCIDLGDEYKESTVRGVDLSPIQPDLLPPNVSFFVDDFEDDWEWPENYFDFIHIRDTMHSVWDRRSFLRRVHRHLKPGGYIEIQEIDFQIYSDDGTYAPGQSQPNALAHFCRYLTQGLTALGISQHPHIHTPAELAAAGFDDVSSDQQIKCPIGGWPRDRGIKLRGLLAQRILMEGLKNLAQRPFAKGLGWTQEQIEVFLMEVRQAVMDDSVHVYTVFHVVYARKPLFGGGGEG